MVCEQVGGTGRALSRSVRANLGASLHDIEISSAKKRVNLGLNVFYEAPIYSRRILQSVHRVLMYFTKRPSSLNIFYKAPI